MTDHTTKSITIYQKSYQLPVLEDSSFQQVQSQIKQRQQVIQTQKRVIVEQKQVQKKALFGLTSYTETIDVTKTQELTFEDKFHELERLVNDYDQLIGFITDHKQVYLQFFAQLTSDLKQVVREKLAEASQQERERLGLLAGETDSELIGILEGQKEQILGNVWLFGKAFLLMLKKIELISEGIEKITTDQDAQRQLLVEMVEKLGKYKKVYSLQRKINQSGKEAEKMAETAVNFEQYLQPFIGSFQGLIDQVCQQDSSLSSTVNEIQSLVEDIMESKTGSFMSSRADDLSKNMLDFLIANEQKKERLVMAVEEAKQQGIDWSWQQIDMQDCGDLTTAIAALQAHIDGKLGDYSQELAPLIDNNIPPNTVGAQGLRPQSSHPTPQPTHDDLSSEKGINYQPLRDLLKAGKWKEADQKTSDLMLQAMGKSGWGSVYKEDLLKLPKNRFTHH
jgi:hypothetical protein